MSDDDASETISEYDAEKRYEELLDSIGEPLKIGSLEYSPGRTLKQIDPIAFRTGMLEYFDSEGIEIE